MDFSQLQLQAGNRAMLVGQTGSGKTYLAKFLLRQFPWVIIHDAKDKLHWPGFRRFNSLTDCIRAVNEPRIIYAPKLEEVDDEEKHDLFFKWIYTCQNRCVFVDEVFSVTSKFSIPRYYKAILTRGRERGITSLNATQRPKDIPQELLSESEQFYIFRLQLQQDRKKITETIPVTDEKIRSLAKLQFLYMDTLNDITAGPLKLDAK